MDREEVARIIRQRGVNLPCHRCGSTTFTVVDGYSRLVLQDEITTSIVLGGNTVPVALVGCSNCGAITPHALGALGLLPNAEADSDEKASGESSDE